MEALWYFSGENGVFSVPDFQIIVNAQGELLPFATTCSEDVESVEEFTGFCRKHQVIILVGDQGRFHDSYLDAIPPELARLAFVTPFTAEVSRHQIDKLGVDAYLFAGMNHNDFVAVTKKAFDDKQATNVLQSEIKKYSDIAFTAMSSASEMGVVALLAESVQSAMDMTKLAQLTLNCINDLAMDGIVQFSFDNSVSIFPEHTSASYKRLLETMRSSNSRIVSHERFLVFSFDHVQLLITNAPIGNNERYGRMRDVLAQIASIAESRAKTLQVNEMLKEQQDNARMVMMLLEMASRDNRNSVKSIMTDLSFSLRQMAMGLDLTLAQETAMTSLADAALEALESLQEATIAVEGHFRSLLAQLDEAANLLDNNKDNKEKNNDEETSTGSKVELF
jgi:hypothetical protein